MKTYYYYFLLRYRRVMSAVRYLRTKDSDHLLELEHYVGMDYFKEASPYKGRQMPNYDKL